MPRAPIAVVPPQLEGPLGAVRARIRLQRAANTTAVLAVAALGVAGLLVGLLKAGAVGEAEVSAWLWACAALPLGGAVLGALRPVRALAAAHLLDRSHGLRSRIASAVELGRIPDARRTPFMRAAIADAAARAPGLDPRRAMPLRSPAGLPAAAVLAAGVVLLSFLEVPGWQALPVALAREPLLLPDDDIRAFSEGLDTLMRDPEAEARVRDAARGFNQLMEDLADRHLHRAEALRRVSELERRLIDGRPAGADEMRDALRDLGEELRRSSLTRAASEALRDADAARAEGRVRELADRLRQDPPSRRELARLREALRRAAERRMPDPQREIERQRREQQRLLQRQRKQGLTERQRRLLQRRRRDLERLQRHQQARQELQRQLQRLQRELGQAAEDLDRGARDEAADSLDQGAQDLNRMARQQRTDEQMRRMSRQLRQLREMLRRQPQRQGQSRRGQGQRGQGRMERFVLRASGGGQGEGIPLNMPGGAQGPQGQGPQGQGPQGQGPRALSLSPGQGNAQLEIPGARGRRARSGPGAGPSGEGPGAGQGHDPTALEDPTHLGGSRRSVRVEGVHAEGPSRSEVILSSAQRGFANRGYERVFTDYRDHAEEVLEHDEVPPGYRFYVRRYFQLIRPREGQADE